MSSRENRNNIFQERGGSAHENTPTNMAKRDATQLNLENSGQRLRIAVIDSGIGIRREDFSKLFKVFGKIT